MPNDMAPRPLRDQTAARIHPPSKTGRPILPATSFFRPDARQVFYAIMVAMPRDGAIIFSDLIGKLDMLRVACERLFPVGIVNVLERSSDVPKIVGQSS